MRARAASWCLGDAVLVALQRILSTPFNLRFVDFLTTMTYFVNAPTVEFLCVHPRHILGGDPFVDRATVVKQVNCKTSELMDAPGTNPVPGTYLKP